MRIQYPTKWQWVWLCVNCKSYADEEDDALKSNLEVVITDAEEKAKNAQQPDIPYGRMHHCLPLPCG